MGHQLGAVVVALTLFAGGKDGPQQIAAGNPHHQCREQGIAFGTKAFEQCIEARIAARCARPGQAPEAPGYARCVDDLRGLVFLTQQLEIRGYRLLDETN